MTTETKVYWSELTGAEQCLVDTIQDAVFSCVLKTGLDVEGYYDKDTYNKYYLLAYKYLNGYLVAEDSGLRDTFPKVWNYLHQNATDYITRHNHELKGELK